MEKEKIKKCIMAQNQSMIYKIASRCNIHEEKVFQAAREVESEGKVRISCNGDCIIFLKEQTNV